MVYFRGIISNSVGGLLFSVAPIGIMLKNLDLSLVGEGNAAGVEHRSGGLIPGAVLVVADQGKAPAGELGTNLMAAAGMEPDVDQRGFAFCQPLEFQPGVFNTFSHPLDYEYLVFAAVFPQKILPIAGLGRGAVDQTAVFFYHSAVLDGFGQPGCGSFCSGIDHNTAHIQVQSVKREYLTAQFFSEQGRERIVPILGADANRLDADNDFFILIKDFHYILSGAEKPRMEMQVSRMFFARPMRAM